MQNIMPILFNTEMVRAILDGRKTTTRRVMKPKCRRNFIGTGIDGKPAECRMVDIDAQEILRHPEPPFQPGDILYVRETWCERLGDISRGKYIYRAQSESQDEIHQYALDQNKWHPSIHMPKVAARIFLRVTGIRTERLQEIKMDGMEAEGCIPPRVNGGQWQQWQRDYFKPLWDGTINKSDLDQYGWAANPWVWVTEFERCEKP